MRIYLEHINVAKNAAKRLRTNHGSVIDLHRYHDVISQMLGYKDFYELQQVTKKHKHKPSLPDEILSLEEQEERLSYQAVKFQEWANVEPVEAYHKVLELRLTAGNRKSLNLLYCNHDTNHLVSSVNKDNHQELFLLLSMRSKKQEYNLLGMAEDGFDDDSYYDCLDIFHTQPENIRCIAYMLETLVESKEKESGVLMARNMVAIAKGLLDEIPDDESVTFRYQLYPHRILFSALWLANEVLKFIGEPQGCEALKTTYQRLALLADNENMYHIEPIH